MTKIQELCREAGAEGAVLLKNENGALPVRKGETVSLFGRIQLHYYKSGTGSGGLVNVDYAVDIPDGLRRAEGISLNEELFEEYRRWQETHPFDPGEGWAMEPFSQEEMPVSDALALRAAERSDLAVVALGRLAGEDRDSAAEKGAYYLSDGELALLRTVRAHFSRVAVVLNVGNAMDMSWDGLCDAVLYVWQGGQEGGNAVADLLTGRATPSGRLADTIPAELGSHPAVKNFGGEEANAYEEDIYVGYRWFETFDQESVKYPFGYGLSYTSFEWGPVAAEEDAEAVTLRVAVKNAGGAPGKEVVQVYAGAPQGKLGQPARALCGFAKTRTLSPGESETAEIRVVKAALASYDDGGVTGHKSCRVLEAGTYILYAGENVRAAREAARFAVPETAVTETLSECMAPALPLRRVRPQRRNGALVPVWEDVPQRTCDPGRRAAARRPAEIPATGVRGVSLRDVKEGKGTLGEFVAQLSDEDLACLTRGEGMCSPKVTAGTAAAFGGLTPRLSRMGVPAGCCADGPSGIRMDSGAHATSVPCGTLLACTFNEALNEALFTELGAEAARHHIDALLGPGMNIHRCPLGGRNFEYFSEDPLLTGRMAAAQVRGLWRSRVAGTVKHYCTNNQEYRRTKVSADLSERALRDIYLRGFEIAVKEGGARAVMSAYGAINRIWAAGNYDLCTTVLRGEWGFDGIVMTDWWAVMNDEGKAPDARNTKAMVRAQNDLYMVVEDSALNSQGDNTLEALAAGELTRGELQRSAANICRFLMEAPCMERREDEDGGAEDDEVSPDAPVDFVLRDGAVLDARGVNTAHGAVAVFTVRVEKTGRYEITMAASTDAEGVAQIPVSLFLQGNAAMFSFKATGGELALRTAAVRAKEGKGTLRLRFERGGLRLRELRFRRAE